MVLIYSPDGRNVGGARGGDGNLRP